MALSFDRKICLPTFGVICMYTQFQSVVGTVLVDDVSALVREFAF